MNEAPYFIVKVISGSRYYWTRDTWSPCFWDAQHYETYDVAYHAMTHACINGALVERRP
jgi:hypothetical protein